MTHAFNYRGVGWRAAVLRQRAGLDQAEAAKLAGITPKTWRNMEDGKPCRYSTIWAAAKAFECSPLWLKYGTEDRDECVAIMLGGAA